MMNRKDFQQITRIRVREAKVLLDNHYYSGAYYLLGYAIECAFKAIIAKQIRQYDIPDRKFINDAYTHDLRKLLNLSNLKSDFDMRKRDPGFDLNWTIVDDWSVESRYLSNKSEAEAKDLYTAVTSRRNGILT